MSSGLLEWRWTIQEELIHVDVLPAVVKLPRRCAFRYMQLTVLDTSAKYKVVVSDVVCRSVTSADMDAVPPLSADDPELETLDQVSLRTMRDCMQLVFETAPSGTGGCGSPTCGSRP